MKLQKREREVESKKQELVSGDNSQIYRFTIQGTPTFSSKSKPFSNDFFGKLKRSIEVKIKNDGDVISAYTGFSLVFSVWE